MRSLLNLSVLANQCTTDQVLVKNQQQHLFWADIIRIARRLSDGNVGKPFNEFRRDLPLANPADVKSNYYFALDTPDEKGKILHLSEIFNSEDISFEQVLQQKAMVQQLVSL